MRLSDLLEFDNIIVQCHDNPDADALASGFGVFEFFRINGKNVRFVYSGKFKVSKSNLVHMINRLEIPVDYVVNQDEVQIDNPQLLVTVDCQYGESNVTKLVADNIAVIDHHQVLGSLPKLSEVRSYQGSCATIVWKMLRDENYDFSLVPTLSTALYYGLMTDTTNFSEIHHPLDRDLRDMIEFNQRDITLFTNSNISRGELLIASEALKTHIYNPDYGYAVVASEPCDPNILGIISDMLLEVDSMNTIIVYSVLDFGVKLSIRSCIVETKASDLATFLCDGNGGGHVVKAGGFIKREYFELKGIDYSKDSIHQFIDSRIRQYFDSTDIYIAGEYSEDVSKLSSYRKRELNLGYVEAGRLFSENKKVTIRTLEGDVDVNLSEDTYIMVGIKGEIYPVIKSKFENSYILSDEKYSYPGDYAPVIRDTSSGKVIPLMEHIKPCISTGGVHIYARKLDRWAKVFTAWDHDNYYLGKPGDYLAFRSDDPSDIYVIEGNVFDISYERI